MPVKKRVIQPKSLNDPRPRYSQGLAVQARRLLFIAGQTASDKSGKIVGKNDIEAQAHQVFKNLGAVLKEGGATFENLVMTTTYITDIKYREGYNRVRTQYYRKTPPTSTLVVIKGLARKEYLLEISGIAVL
jgi:enamine deaminase RidA (YjgF/YER057c/UK114 family)